jgi:hypothetical protein
MIETALVAAIVVPIFAIQIYNARQIADLKNKIDLIYDNLDIKLDFKTE